MSTEDQLSKEIESALGRLLRAPGETSPGAIAAGADVSAEAALGAEVSTLEEARQREHIRDLVSAREQRERYARNVFYLVSAWVVALFILLVAQGLYRGWRPFSDTVLVALISSMTINLIGTLVIVLKYIFREPQKQA